MIAVEPFHANRRAGQTNLPPHSAVRNKIFECPGANTYQARVVESCTNAAAAV